MYQWSVGFGQRHGHGTELLVVRGTLAKQILHRLGASAADRLSKLSAALLRSHQTGELAKDGWVTTAVDQIRRTLAHAVRDAHVGGNAASLLQHVVDLAGLVDPVGHSLLATPEHVGWRLQCVHELAELWVLCGVDQATELLSGHVSGSIELAAHHFGSGANATHDLAGDEASGHGGQQLVLCGQQVFSHGRSHLHGGLASQCLCAFSQRLAHTCLERTLADVLHGRHDALLERRGHATSDFAEHGSRHSSFQSRADGTLASGDAQTLTGTALHGLWRGVHLSGCFASFLWERASGGTQEFSLAGSQVAQAKATGTKAGGESTTGSSGDGRDGLAKSLSSEACGTRNRVDVAYRCDRRAQAGHVLLDPVDLI